MRCLRKTETLSSLISTVTNYYLTTRAVRLHLEATRQIETQGVGKTHQGGRK